MPKVSKILPFQRGSKKWACSFKSSWPLFWLWLPESYKYFFPPHLALTCALQFHKSLCNKLPAICDTIWKMRYRDKYQTYLLHPYLRSQQDKRENTCIISTHHTIGNIIIKVNMQVRSLMETMRRDWPGTESRLYFRWFWMISNGRSFQAGEDLPDRRTNKNWEPQNKRASKVKIFLGTRSHREVSWEGWHRGVEGVESEATGWESVYRSIKILHTILKNLDFIYFVCVEYLPCGQNCLDSQIKTQDPDSALKEASISGGDRQIGVRRANIYRALTLVPVLYLHYIMYSLQHPVRYY